MPNLASVLRQQPSLSLALTGVLTLATAACHRPSLAAASRPAAQFAPATVATSGAPAIGGPFRLFDQYGRQVDQGLLRGKWSIVYFGYTFCPDVCPATLTALAAAERELGPDAGRLQVVFITVDPARDSPAQLRGWLRGPSFPPHVIGLTGTPSQIAAVARGYGVYFRRNGPGRDYGVDHTSVLYLMNPSGAFARPLPQNDPDLIASQIEQAIHAT